MVLINLDKPWLDKLDLPNGEFIAYVRRLIERAAPEQDAAMIVDFIPYTEELCRRLEHWQSEYDILRKDYEDLRTERMKQSWKLSLSQPSEGSPSASPPGSPSNTSRRGFFSGKGRRPQS